MQNNFLLYPILLLFQAMICQPVHSQKRDIVTGAERTGEYLPLIQNKRVMLVVNQTSRIEEIHLVDSLKNLGIRIEGIFAPEHGFRGDHGAGEKVQSGLDEKTGLKVISLYGNMRKPRPEHLKEIDWVIFDIQDVGARFYTYISTLHYVMEACAENGVKLLVLDRPNPNGYYVDGPVLDTAHRSFVGMHPVPVVHGMTVGEYAQMINGEGWLSKGLKCDLQVVRVENYTHKMRYGLPVAPSPNLPNDRAILLYPTLCFFEGTEVSVGRGTDWPFQMIGAPGSRVKDTSFTPRPDPHAAPNPPFKGQVCYGHSFVSEIPLPLSDSAFFGLQWHWISRMMEAHTGKTPYFNSFFLKLAGTPELRKLLEERKSEEEISHYFRNTPSFKAFLEIREMYLLYDNFD